MDDGRAGFITGSFEREQRHGRNYDVFTANWASLNPKPVSRQPKEVLREGGPSVPAAPLLRILGRNPLFALRRAIGVEDDSLKQIHRAVELWIT